VVQRQRLLTGLITGLLLFQAWTPQQTAVLALRIGIPLCRNNRA